MGKRLCLLTLSLLCLCGWITSVHAEESTGSIRVKFEKAGDPKKPKKQHDIVIITCDNQDPLRCVLVTLYPYDEAKRQKEEGGQGEALQPKDLTFHFENGFTDKLMAVRVEGKTLSGKEVSYVWSRVRISYASRGKTK